MSLPGIILADAGDVIGIIVFIVIAGIGALSQLASKAKEGQKQQAARPQRPPPQAGRAQAAGRPKAGQGPLKQEIEEFLRRATQGQPARPARQQENFYQRPAAAVVKRPAAVELVEEVGQRERVAEHVRRMAGRYIEHLPPTAAAGLAAMLAEPGNLRQAILLSEILQRPEHRWS